MKREEYRSLFNEPAIKNASLDDVIRFCPHLTTEQVIAALNDKIPGGCWIACPPIKVDGAYHVLNYSNEGTLSFGHPNRTLASYVDGKKRGDVFTNTPYTAEAIAFARTHWKDDLVIDDWGTVLNVYIRNPREMMHEEFTTANKFAKIVKAVVYQTLERDYNTLVNHDRHQALSVALDAETDHLTTDYIEAMEMVGGRGGYSFSVCAICGTGLNWDHCSGCGHTFPRRILMDTGSFPISKKMSAFLETKGFQFEIDPDIARQAESDSWNFWYERRKRVHQ